MNWRKKVYLSYAAGRGYRFPSYLSEYAGAWESGRAGEIAATALNRLLGHCWHSVPYYTELLERAGYNPSASREPWETLLRLPVLRKETIRANFTRLRSLDLRTRKWSYNTSGGSTGEPIDLIQDSEYENRSKAISLLYQWLLGCEVGETLVRFWGSERDIDGGTRSPKARFFNWLTNTTWMNAFQMSPERMRQFVATLNQVRPRLIIAYAQAAYELARFVEREKLGLEPQRAIVTSAGTLYPFMREKITQVFGCKVYNLYGSREVSDIACELPCADDPGPERGHSCPQHRIELQRDCGGDVARNDFGGAADRNVRGPLNGHGGLCVAPWGNYVEILDDEGKPVPPGEEGNIAVTSLTNYAMPLVRYWIGDRGALMPESEIRNKALPGIQVLKHVSGRNVDVFRTRDQTLIDGEYFTHLLYFRPWVWKFQVIQKSYEDVLFRVVRSNGAPPRDELEEIAAKARLVMGADCRVDFEFPSELPPHPSGKYRYTISEVEPLNEC